MAGIIILLWLNILMYIVININYFFSHANTVLKIHVHDIRNMYLIFILWY